MYTTLLTSKEDCHKVVTLQIQSCTFFYGRGKIVSFIFFCRFFIFRSWYMFLEIFSSLPLYCSWLLILPLGCKIHYRIYSYFIYDLLLRLRFNFHSVVYYASVYRYLLIHMSIRLFWEQYWLHWARCQISASSISIGLPSFLPWTDRLFLLHLLA